MEDFVNAETLISFIILVGAICFAYAVLKGK